MRCEHCNKEYETESEFMKDCFVSSDGWSYDYFHNCLENKGIEIHGYKKQLNNYQGGLDMNLDKIKKQWDYYCKETDENDFVDVDLHYSMAMEVGALIREIERLQDELNQRQDNS